MGTVKATTINFITAVAALSLLHAFAEDKKPEPPKTPTLTIEQKLELSQIETDFFAASAMELRGCSSSPDCVKGKQDQETLKTKHVETQGRILREIKACAGAEITKTKFRPEDRADWVVRCPEQTPIVTAPAKPVAPPAKPVAEKP